MTNYDFIDISNAKVAYERDARRIAIQYGKKAYETMMTEFDKFSNARRNNELYTYIDGVKRRAKIVVKSVY